MIFNWRKLFTAFIPKKEAPSFKFGGCSVIVDKSLPAGTIEVRDREGVTVCRIVNLAEGR